MLDLGLRELAHAQQPRARRDLVAVRLPNLRGRKGQLAAVVVQQVPAQTLRLHHTGELPSMPFSSTVEPAIVAYTALKRRGLHHEMSGYDRKYHGL